MTTTRYIALLRGINVGGNNLIKMADLKACFEEIGFADVTTYIQSGNVLFTATQKKTAELEKLIEDTLSKQFSYSSRVVLLTSAQLQQIVAGAPPGFGSDVDKYRYDVLFLKAPLTADKALQQIQTREGVDQVFAGADVLYFQRLVTRAGQSYLSKVVALPIYQQMTIRNWNTSTRLLKLVE